VPGELRCGPPDAVEANSAVPELPETAVCVPRWSKPALNVSAKECEWEANRIAGSSPPVA